jgi:hypothetical protein
LSCGGRLHRTNRPDPLWTLIGASSPWIADQALATSNRTMDPHQPVPSPGGRDGLPVNAGWSVVAMRTTMPD